MIYSIIVYVLQLPDVDIYMYPPATPALPALTTAKYLPVESDATLQ